MSREEEVLRRVLAAEASGVDVEAQALVEIRRRIEARRARWWRPERGSAMLASAALALSAGAAAAVVGFVSCVPQPAGPDLRPGHTGSPSATAAPPGTVPVYYLGPESTTTGSRLYREFHPLQAREATAEERTRVAVAAALDARSAFDPDYTSAWPAGTHLRQVRIDGDVVTVDLGGANDRYPDPSGKSPGPASMAVQQVVWTATAASGAGGVRLLLDGQTAAVLWDQAQIHDVLRRGSAAAVLAPVWLIDPQHGARVGKAFRARIAGIVFEGSVRLRVRDGAGRVVDERGVQLDRAAPNQGTAEVDLELPPGSYRVEAYVVSARDGSEQGLDDHVITVV